MEVKHLIEGRESRMMLPINPLCLSLETDNTHLDKSLGVYLVYSIARCPARLVVKEVTLNKDAVFAHTVNPYFSFILLVENDT